MSRDQEILDARRPEEIFGDLTGDTDERLEQARRLYRELAREVHPDMRPAEERDIAQRAFARLSRLWQVVQTSITDVTYGAVTAPLVDEVVIRTRRRAYKVTEPFARGDCSNLYRCSYEDDDERKDGLLKIARSTSSNTLIANEAKTLKHLLSEHETYDLIQPYLPRYIESFGYRRPGDRKPHQASAFAHTPGLYSLAQVREQYPAGVDPKDMAWMFRRLLMALGLVHSLGVVHGAVLPEHVLIHPEQHGLVLVDWTHSVRAGEAVKTISAGRREWYPPEVLAKDTALPGTDIYMAVACMVYVMGGDPETMTLPAAPRPLSAFVRGCTMQAVRRRPQDALSLLDEFNDLLERLYGPRRFRPFAMRPVER